jgi:hypothetical protein
LLLTSTVSAEGFFDFLFPTPTPTPVPEIDLSKVNETKIYTDIETGLTTKVIYEVISIKNQSESKDPSLVVVEETNKILNNVTFPYSIIENQYTFFTIEKYRCTGDLCGYWISAYRGGYEVQTDSPIWIRNAPYRIIISETYDEKTNENVIVLREDPKSAAEEVLQRYVDGQPLGPATVGTKA